MLKSYFTIMSANKSRYVPYSLPRLPSQIVAATTEWRRNNAKTVETEILKPESILPVTTGSTGGSPICFTIKGLPNLRVDGNNIFIETTFSIEKYSGNQWVPTELNKEGAAEVRVLPIANTACSMFEDLNVLINGVHVENTQREFAIKTYLQNMLFSTPSDRERWNQTALLCLDKPAHHNVISTAATQPELFGNNPSQAIRGLTTDGTKQHTVYTRLLSDALSCSEPLPDNVNITVKLYPAKSEACLIQNQIRATAETLFRLKISECTLYVPRVTTKVNRSIDRTFSYTNWRTLAYTHQSGQSNFRKDIAIGETLPQKAIVVFMPEDQYNGSWYSSKFDLKHANVSSIVMKCNQRHVPFMNGYQCDFENDIYNTPYDGLTTELGASMHPIIYHGFDDGYAVFGFDVTPNKTGSIALETALRGALELDIEFKTASTVNMMVVVLLIYADKFTITKTGNVV